MNFTETDLNDYLLDALDSMGFEQCTPIQEKAIPPLLEGRDLIGVAQTGTGKTAAFLLPVLNELSYGDYPADHINCLIMAPTRELAKQIDEQLQGFSYFVPVSSSAVYGGNDGPEFARQRQGLKLGADIIVATPGRLISHLSLGYVDLSQVSFFILDEADRMLDMGFSEDILQIASFLPKERQTIMFSATMPPKIQKLAQTILTDPVRVEIAVSKPAEKICQQAVYLYETQKLNAVKEIFASMETPARSLIFASSKLKVKELARTLRQHHYDVAEMHSDLDQAQRDEVMHRFKNGTVKMLVATDIVARGIDIDDIGLVMNFDVPREGEDYVHRIGRTARAGAEGRAITLVNEKDLSRFRRIEKFLGKPVEKLELACAVMDVEPAKTSRSTGKKTAQRHGGKKGEGRADKERRRRPQDGDGQTSEAQAVITDGATSQGKNESGRGRRHRGGRKHRKDNSTKENATAEATSMSAPASASDTQSSAESVSTGRRSRGGRHRRRRGPKEGANTAAAAVAAPITDD